MQDAVRILLIIDTVAEPVSDPPPEEAPDHAVGVVRSQVLLQKLDFWVRSPDYLADELLSRFEDTGNEDDLALAEQILDSDEPEVRSYPMLRYLFGAYESLDEALAVLATPGLVFARRRGSTSRTTLWNYYITERGREVARKSLTTAPALDYYVDRSAVVSDLAAGRRGSVLRDIQYLHTEYADTDWGDYIASISERARTRLAAILRERSQN